MKLKTKFQDEDFDLGEVINANIYYGGHNRIKLIATAARGGEHTFYFESLKELNEMFEDYEEPKEYWGIDMYSRGVEDFKNSRDDVDKFNKSIGNYFDTREEAEKAVEKLKAWKRLKDNGFRHTHFVIDHKTKSAKVVFNAQELGLTFKVAKQFYEDFYLLFGGDDGVDG